ncbi:MAG: FHA domain-containing protein, partial [Anaerolineales bacterium]
MKNSPTGNKKFILHLAVGDGEWVERSLDEGVYILGRASDCQIILPGNEVSRRHAQVEIAQDGMWIMDLGSANGTQLDGNPLSPRRRTILQPHQVVAISCYRLRIEPAKGEEVPVPIPSTEEQLQTIAAGQFAFSHEFSASAVRTLAEGGEQAAVVTRPGEVQPPPPPPTPLVPARQVVLQYRQGQGNWISYTLNEGDQFIGREAGNHIVLDSTSVSRRHARVTLISGMVSITDLGSKNGVYKNGQRLNPHQSYPLEPGENFQIDEFFFELKSSGIPQKQPARTPPAPPPTPLQAPCGEVSTVVALDLGEAAVPMPSGRLNLLGQDRVSIGRAPDNQIVLDHPMVSRYHAVIERLGTRSRIINTHSANGVFVNGQQVEHMTWLTPGDAIKIGPYQFQFSGNELQRSATLEGYEIDVIGVNKWVSKTVNLLKDISLHIGQNEFVALVGMSGAGKSTLMDAINGFRPGTSGQVLVNGVDLYRNYESFRDDIGNVPQKDIVHMELTPEQALDYAARLRMPSDTTAAERKAAVNATLNDLGLTFKKDVPISRLSGGQLKRVSIGVELLTRPRLFFLDEPTSGLDPGTEYEMMKLLRHLADQGRTIMLITHATKNVMFCDKTIILARGGILAFYGPPEEALEYFDQFRTPRERLEKDMEFDDIYRILQDDSRGKPEDWRERYLTSKYAKYCQPKFSPVQAAQKAVPAAKRRHRISALKQFFVLSARTMRCMIQDRASLGLTLALAPVLGLMNFIWGTKLFDPVQGDSTKALGLWFVTAVIAILVGSMGSVREIVKENEIYKRERAVGLRILPYILSKVWIGMALSIYQGIIILFFVFILARPVVNSALAYPAMMITMILMIICGYLMGLMISAIAPNQNAAQLLLIAAFVPQLLFAGLLMPIQRIPLGEIISPLMSTRWGFEAFVNASGMGDMLVKDPCWSLSKEHRIKLSPTQKEACLCLGANIFKNCANFPGILSPDFYDEDAKIALSQGEPQKPPQPTRYPSPTPRHTPTQYPTPTLLPTPTFLPTPSPYPTPTRLPIHLGGSPERRATDYAGLSPEEIQTRA